MARIAPWAALLAAAGLALTGCTAPTALVSPSPPPTPSVTPTPTPTPTVHTAELRLPDDAVSVLSEVTPADRAVATSTAFFASAPVAVLAPADDVAAQTRAASVAVALGAPLLLVGEAAPAGDEPGGPTPDDVTGDELDRLGVLAVVTVGTEADLTDLGDVVVVPAPQDRDALIEVLRVELGSATEPEVGAEVAAVAALDRDATVLMDEPRPEPEPGAPTEEAVDPAAPTDPTPSASASPSPTATPTPSPSASPTASPSPAADEALPRTEKAAPLTGGVLLMTGDPGDLAAVATARAAGVEVLLVPGGDPRAHSETIQALAADGADVVIGLGPEFGTTDDLTWKVATAATGVELPGGGQTLFPGRRFVALYGTPTYPALGILGEQDVQASIERARGLAAEYQALTDDDVVPAFEMIVTVASAGPGEDGNYSNELPIETFLPWIEAARDAGVYVVLDLQPGRTDFLTQARLYEQLLLYPNVGLALDPEWRLKPDQVHLRQIGSVHIDEVNAVQAYLAELTRTNALPQKLFVLHQFQHRMIEGRENVVTTHPEIAVLIHVDGQGSQGAKAGTWASLQQGAPAGVAWGWKNFLDEDIPTLDPAGTYQVQPVPEFVSYQ